MDKTIAEPQSQVTLEGDLLVGASAIATALGWKGASGRRRVYHLAAKGSLPIRRVDGLGLCARKSALERFFSGLDWTPD